MWLQCMQPSYTLPQLSLPPWRPNGRWVDLHETAINPIPRPNINLPSSRTWSTRRLRDCRRPTASSPLPSSTKLHSLDQPTTLFWLGDSRWMRAVQIMRGRRVQVPLHLYHVSPKVSPVETPFCLHENTHTHTHTHTYTPVSFICPVAILVTHIDCFLWNVILWQ